MYEDVEDAVILEERLAESVVPASRECGKSGLPLRDFLPRRPAQSFPPAFSRSARIASPPFSNSLSLTSANSFSLRHSTAASLHVTLQYSNSLLLALLASNPAYRSSVIGLRSLNARTNLFQSLRAAYRLSTSSSLGGVAGR